MDSRLIVKTGLLFQAPALSFNWRMLARFVQMLGYSLFLSHLILSPNAYAGPTGGTVVGGSGSINQSGLTTAIKQNSSALAINWNSYNLNANEIVNYIQPSAASIALNRIIGGSASQIHGQINANGQVVLVNPNGVFFGQNASVNVGGLIASGLDINPVDFMNGDYLFNAIDGTTGAVVNAGLLNASLGGSITLLGKQVSNHGLITANLGAVNLAAGKAAVLTFDHAGLIGVQVTESMLQDELGLDPAVLNSGDIKAKSGRVLLTASQSQDVFSAAVNSNGIDQATSVVVNEDGSFTLGGGADVVNSGSIDVSATNAAGQVVALGEMVTNSGSIHADTLNGNGGDIELHSNDTTQITGNSSITARAEGMGHGGEIKILGDKVGLFDQSLVDASGANGGGEILIGGDNQGLNANVPNAAFIYLGENTSIKADAVDSGNGGKIITFADDSARIYGDLSARGGSRGGNGGFIETSGLKYFQITAAPVISANFGSAGEWLIDPNNITIVDAGSGNGFISATNPFVTSNDNALLDVSLITAALTGGANVTITTGIAGANTQAGNITFNTDLDYNGTGANTLTLNAINNINTLLSNITDSDTGMGTDSLNLVFNAANNVIVNDSDIDTNGGSFSASGVNFTSNRTSSTEIMDTAGGDVTLTMTGDVSIGAEIITNGGNFTVASSASFDNSDLSDDVGNIDTGSANISITSSGTVILGELDTSGDFTVIAGGDISDGSNANVNIAGSSIFTAGANDITLVHTDNDFLGSVTVVSANNLTLSQNNDITLGNVSITGALDVDVVTDQPITGNISQAAGTTLSVAGISSFATAESNADITLLNPGNDLQGAISASTQGTNEGHIEISNSSALTTLGTISAFGNLTINAANNLDIDGTVFVSNERSGGNFDRFADLNFGASGAASTFNLNATGSLVADSDGSTGDTVSFRITSGVGDSFFNFNALATISLTADDSVSATGGNGLDTFNVNAALPATLDGAGGNDVINASNNLNAWTVSGLNQGNLDSGGAVTGFVNIERLNGGSGIDTLTGPNQDVSWDIGAGSGNLSNGSQLLTMGFFGFENYTGGSGDDTFVIATAGSFGLIDGGNETSMDILDLSARAVNLITIGTDFTDIERVIGNQTNSTLVAENLANNWTITGDNTGNVNSSNGIVEFVDFNNLTGNANVDTFVFNAGSISGIIDAAAGNDVIDYSGLAVVSISLANAFNGVINAETIRGNDSDSTLTGDNVNSTWNITGNNDGDVGAVNFEDFNNLIGGSANDNFVFSFGALITGLITGGNAIIQDTVDYSALNNFSVTLGQDITGIERITGDNTSSTLIATDIDNTWNIIGQNDGNVAGVSFINFSSLTGGSADDTFVMVAAASSLTGNLDGGSQTMADVVDFSGLATVNVNVNDFGGFPDIEQIVGNNSNSTLTGANQANTWTITGVNTGNVNAFAFSGFDKLIGGNQQDIFNVSGNSSLTGITGGLNDDVVNVTLSGGESGSINFDGGVGSDTVNLIGGAGGYSGQYNNNAVDQGLFNYTQGVDSFAVGYSAAESVNDDLIAANLTVIGTVGSDNIGLATNQFTVNGETVNYTGKAALNVNALIGGNDVIDITGNVNLAGSSLVLNAESVTNSSGSAIVATDLRFNNVNTVGTSLAPITANSDQLFFSNVSGDVFFIEQNQVSIGELNVLGGSFNLTAQLGDIQDSAALISNTNLQLVAQNGNIQLDNANQLGGELSLAATNGNITVNNGINTQLATVEAQNLSISSTGQIIEAAGSAILVTNSTVLAAPGQNITLVGVGHSFTSLAVSSAANLTLVDSNGGGLTLSAINVSGNATLTVAGNLNTGQVVVGGTADLTTPGAVVDGNGDAMNFITPNLRLNAANGIGDGNAIETQVVSLDAVNSSSGEIRIQQTGDININALQNTGAQGDIDLFTDRNIRFNPGSVVAALGSGDLLMTTSQGSFLGLGSADISNPDITAQNAIFFGRAGNFGSLQRPLTLNVPGNVFIDTRGFFDPSFVPPGPSSLITTGIDFGILAGISSILGDQLVDIESLGAIDPAIFTELKNYSAEEVSILLPQDQLYEDELEEEQ